jgi:23S rRNA (adenine2503-C2)-methyltransferase
MSSSVGRQRAKRFVNCESDKTLVGMDRRELVALMQAASEPAYRATQIAEAIYRLRLNSIDEISTIPRQLRSQLRNMRFSVGPPEIQRKFKSQDGTVRYLMAFSDQQTVETVWMPEGDDGEKGDGSDAGEASQENSSRTWDRATICISSQVGCAVDCQFCLTALLGVKRNLYAGEIVGQVLAVLREQNVSPPEDRINLVFMGMGEPFLNYDNFIKAARLLADEVGIPESRMTVSTAGIVPRIVDFGKEMIRPKLAISLNASNNELRTQLMPVNRKWDLEKLMTAAREFPLRNRERITFEYVLLNAVNDSPENATEVVGLLRGIRAKVNLIAFNPGPGVQFSTPSQEKVLAFQNILMRAGIPAFIRRPRGRDIFAACGQLKRTVEIATASEP